MSRTRQWYYDSVAIPGATGKTVTVGVGQDDPSKWECRTQVDYGADSVAALVGWVSPFTSENLTDESANNITDESGNALTSSGA